MCEIQKWLADNKILTIGALRFERTGQTRYQRALIAPYAWPDKTLYDILARQEYLGHTITAKNYKAVSYTHLLALLPCFWTGKEYYQHSF